MCHGLEGEESLHESKSADGGKKDRMKKKKKNKKNKVKEIDEEKLQVSKSADGAKKDRMKKENNKDKGIEEVISEVRKSSNENSDTEEDFWMPPAGDRWDNDDGGDRWGSESEQGTEEGDVIGMYTPHACSTQMRFNLISN